MTSLNVHEAKTHFSRYLDRVQQGETIIICKNDVPVAQLTPLPKDKKPKRKLFGLGKGKGKILPSFFDDLSDEDFPGIGL